MYEQSTHKDSVELTFRESSASVSMESMNGKCEKRRASDLRFLIVKCTLKKVLLKHCSQLTSDGDSDVKARQFTPNVKARLDSDQNQRKAWLGSARTQPRACLGSARLGSGL